MKKIAFSVFTGIVFVCVCIAQVYAEELPESVQNQSRKNAVESETWKKFDQSGQVKFLQLQHTAAASEAGTGSKLDGSLGERLVEIKIDPAIQADVVEWTLKNKGPSPVWVVAVSDSDVAVPVEIAVEASITLQTKLVDSYCYIVVDSEGGKETTLDITAKCGDVEAKTARGNSMNIVWF